MAIYSVSLVSNNFAAGLAQAEISTGSRRCRLLEIMYQMGNGVSGGRLGLARPTVLASTPTLVPFQAEWPDDPPSTTAMATAWAASPIAPATYIRLGQSPNAQGSATLFTFPRGLVIPPHSAVALFSITQCSQGRITAVIDEGGRENL